QLDLTKLIFGRLTWQAVPYHEPILVWTFVAIALIGMGVVAWVTKARLWGYLWSEWFTSIDHRKIGIMYIVLGLVMLLRGLADAIMMRLQLALALCGNIGYLPPEHYAQIFTALGVILMFFVVRPLVTGFLKYVVPLQ